MKHFITFLNFVTDLDFRRGGGGLTDIFHFLIIVLPLTYCTWAARGILTTAWASSWDF